MRGKGYTVISNKILNDSSLNIYEKYFIIALKSFDHKNIGEAYPTYETLMNLLGTSNRNTISNIISKILNDSNLNIYEKYFIIALKSFDHKNIGEAYPTYETLMNLLGTSNRNTISNIISSLKNKKYIEVIKKDRVNCYKFIKDYLLDVRSNRLNTTTSNELDTSKSNSLDTTTSNSKNTSGVKKDENSNENDTLNSNTNDTQKIKDKKEIYISVLKKWNEKNIANEIDLSSSIESDIEHALMRLT